MKVKKVIASFLIVATISAISAIGASAYNEDWNLSASYGPRTILQIDESLIMYYDIGSAFPYDDVRASTVLGIGPGMSGYSYTRVTALNGNQASNYSTYISGGSINSGDAIVASQDYATAIWNHGDRTNSVGSKESWDVYVS